MCGNSMDFKIGRWLVVLLFVFCTGSARQANASHVAGGELLYEWVRDSTYRLVFKFYRDCENDQAGAPGEVSVCYRNECSGFTGNVTLYPVSDPANGSEVSPACPRYATTCNSGYLPGYQEWVYNAEVTLPSRCHTWRFYASAYARNNAIANLAGPAGSDLWTEATLNNEAAQGNSSPRFSVKPVPYICFNEPYTYNNGAVDVNADSLYFEHIQPRKGVAVCNSSGVPSVINYTGGYSLSEPFSTGGTFNLNSTTGELSFTPVVVQMAAIALRVTEYRNGVRIGSVMRDIQFVVMPCYSPQPVVKTDTASLAGLTLDAGRLNGCAGSALRFCVDVKSPDKDAMLVLSDNGSTALPGSLFAYEGQGTDSLRVCISWTPGYLDTGLRILVLTVKDSTCRPPGLPIIQTFTIPVYISSATGIFKDTSLCPGDRVELIAAGGNFFQWGVLPGGSPLSSLSCTTCPNPVAAPDRTTHYTVVTDNASVCNKNRDTVTIKVVTPPVIDLGPDIITCVTNPTQLTLNLPAVPGTDYHIAWTPVTYLDDPASATPVADAGDDITYYVVVRPDGLEYCSARDTISLTVLKGFDLITGDTIICAGDAVPVRVTGDTRYDYAWAPGHGITDTTVMAPVILPDSSQEYIVTASYAGCRDSIRSLLIEVQPTPVVDLGGDQALCYGNKLQLAPETDPADYPLYTYTWNPPGSLNPGPDVREPIYTAYQTTTLTLTVSTPAGCTGSDDKLIRVSQPDIITASPDTAICPGDTVQLRVWGSQVSQVWRPAEYISDTLSPTPYVFPSSSVAYTVYGRDADNCLDTQVVHVRVLPAALVSLRDSARIAAGGSIHLEPGGNCLYFEWFPESGLSDPRISNPVATPEVHTRYIVNARTEEGCPASDTIDVFVEEDSYIDVPNAFVPGNGPNGRLRPVHYGRVTLHAFSVYNRWGVKLYETRDLHTGWDGTYQGVPQPAGVYVYTVDATTAHGRHVRKQGNVMLLR